MHEVSTGGNYNIIGLDEMYRCQVILVKFLINNNLVHPLIISSQQLQYHVVHKSNYFTREHTNTNNLLQGKWLSEEIQAKIETLPITLIKA